jgi:hypothetical protein
MVELIVVDIHSLNTPDSVKRFRGIDESVLAHH